MADQSRLTQGLKRWFILAGVFFVSFLETGTVRSFGVILNDMTSEFQTSTAYIGTIIGMSHGATYWLAVMNTPLLRRFSVRQVVMAGGLVGSLGLILSSFAETGPQFAAALFMFGIGFSTVVLPANSSPVDYFPDLFEIASSINLSGGGVGLMILPLLFEVFVVNYGWRSALLLLGALNLNTLVSGALLEPVTPTTSPTKGDKERKSIASTSESKALINDNNTSFDREPVEENETSDRTRLADANGGVSVEVNPEPKHNGKVSANVNYNCKSEGKKLVDQIDASESNHTDRSSHVYDESTSSKNNFHDLVVSVDTKENTLSIKHTLVEDYSKCKKERPFVISYICQWFSSLAKSFDLYLFADYPIFFGICLATVLFGMSYDGWVLFVIPNAEAKGFSSSKAVYIATAGGVGNILGRFCIGFFTSRRIIRNEVTYFLLNVMSAVAFCVNFFANTFWFLSILSFVNGFSLGAKTSLQFIIVNGSVATERYKAAVSMLLVSLGLGFPISGALLGGIYDRTQSYDLSFCVIGLIDVICGCLITAPLVAAFCRRKCGKQNEVDEPSEV